jgi:hypothetical protein
MGRPPQAWSTLIKSSKERTDEATRKKQQQHPRNARIQPSTTSLSCECKTMLKSAASTGKQEETDAAQALLQLQGAEIKENFIDELNRRLASVVKKIHGLMRIMQGTKRVHPRHMGEYNDRVAELREVLSEIKQHEDTMRSLNR